MTNEEKNYVKQLFIQQVWQQQVLEQGWHRFRVVIMQLFLQYN